MHTAPTIHFNVYFNEKPKEKGDECERKASELFEEDSTLSIFDGASLPLGIVFTAANADCKQLPSGTSGTSGTHFKKLREIELVDSYFV